VTGYPDDPSEAPTGQYNYGNDADYGQHDPTPWHRKPAVLIGLGVLVAILIALVIYGIVELNQGGGANPPGTSSVSTTPSTSFAVSSSETTSAPVAPAPTSNPTSNPTTSTPTSTSADDSHHHHHHHDGWMP
jgi:cytoskeletal protein RodZ